MEVRLFIACVKYMQKDLQEIAFQWVASEFSEKPKDDYYCETRDIFQARLDRMIGDLIREKQADEDDIYLISAMAGEIGNNSFDHNLGIWPDIMGVFFGYEFWGGGLKIILADRGQGLFKTLKRVKPELKNDSEALFAAFNERISGRAPESRGNGLKFVKENIKDKKMHLRFSSGNAEALLNEKMEISKVNYNTRGCLAIISCNICVLN